MNTAVKYENESPVFSRTPAVRRSRQAIYTDQKLVEAIKGIRERLAGILGMFPADGYYNPYYGHTQDGLVLACSYGTPHLILSPYGQFAIHNGGSCKEPNWMGYLDDLKLSELAPRMYIDNHMFGGEKGPIYTIGNFNGPLSPACCDLQAVAVSGWRGSLSFDLELESLRGKATLQELSERFAVPVSMLKEAEDETSGHISIRTLRRQIVEHYWSAWAALEG